MTDQPVFDPATARRGCALRMSDMLCHLLLPQLVRRLRAEAPGVTLKTAHLGPEATVDALERDDIELALSTSLTIPKSIVATTLFDDRVVVPDARSDLLRGLVPKPHVLGPSALFPVGLFDCGLRVL
jgi:DNA-binding transcriptional LysR family regulator